MILLWHRLKVLHIVNLRIFSSLSTCHLLITTNKCSTYETFFSYQIMTIISKSLHTISLSAQYTLVVFTLISIWNIVDQMQRIYIYIWRYLKKGFVYGNDRTPLKVNVFLMFFCSKKMKHWPSYWKLSSFSSILMKKYELISSTFCWCMMLSFHSIINDKVSNCIWWSTICFFLSLSISKRRKKFIFELSHPSTVDNDNDWSRWYMYVGFRWIYLDTWLSICLSPSTTRREIFLRTVITTSLFSVNLYINTMQWKKHKRRWNDPL